MYKFRRLTQRDPAGRPDAVLSARVQADVALIPTESGGSIVLRRHRDSGRREARPRRTKLIVTGCVTFALAAAGGAVAGDLADQVSSTPFGTPTSNLPPDPGASIAAVRGDRANNWLDQARSEVLARHGIVATSQPLGVQAGLQILRKGGNAADAAVATAAEMGVVEPYSAGIGGDMFLLYYSAKDRRVAWAQREWMVATVVDTEVFNDRGYNASTGMPLHGVNSITVPGAVDGWDQLLKRFGTMSFAQVLAPAIETAQQGFGVTERIHVDWNDPYYTALMRKDPDSASTFLVDGQAPRLYSIFRNPGLAKAYELIATQGRDAFYNGPIAKAIMAKVNGLGAKWEPSDLSNFHAQWVTPIHTNYKGYDVYEDPPNSQGMATLEMLNILEQCGPRVGFNLHDLGPRSPQYWAALVEAKRLAFRDLSFYDGDPRFTHVPLDVLLSKSHAASLCQYMNLNHEPPIPPIGTPVDRACGRQRRPSRCASAATPCTSRSPTAGATWHRYFTKSSASTTTSAATLTVPGYGFPLQDRGYFFLARPPVAHVVAPHKRPFHTITLAFVMKDGQPLLSFGSMGGTEQVQAQGQELVNMIDLGHEPTGGRGTRHASSTSRAQTNSTWRPTSTTSSDPRLKAMGFDPVRATGENMGGYQAILFTPMSQAGPTGGASGRAHPRMAERIRR